MNFRQRHLTENERQKEEGDKKNTFAKCAIYLHREYNNKSVIYLSSERERLKRKRERERKRVAVVVVVIAVVGVAKKRPWVVLRNEKSAARAFFSP